MRYLKLAEKLSLEYNYDDGLEYFLCAVIARGGNVLSVGYNKKSTNAFVEHYADVARGVRDYCMSTHAEMSAVLSARGKHDLTGTKLYVVRTKPSGGLGMARPCPICYRVLQSYGIKKAYYSISDEEYGVMKIKSDQEYEELKDLEYEPILY